MVGRVQRYGGGKPPSRRMRFPQLVERLHNQYKNASNSEEKNQLALNQSQWRRADRNITPSYQLKEAIQADLDAGIRPYFGRKGFLSRSYPVL